MKVMGDGAAVLAKRELDSAAQRVLSPAQLAAIRAKMNEKMAALRK